MVLCKTKDNRTGQHPLKQFNAIHRTPYLEGKSCVSIRDTEGVFQIPHSERFFFSDAVILYLDIHISILPHTKPLSTIIPGCQVIIIMSCRQHGYAWPSLTTSSYHSSPLAGPQAYIPYPHIAAVCMFELVVLLLLGHMQGSIGVRHLWARPGCSSCVRKFSLFPNCAGRS